MELNDLRGVGSATEERLNQAGIESVNELAEASLEDFEDTGMSEGKANKLITRAKQNAVIIQSGEDVRKEYEKKDMISTGIDLLDDHLNGGWEESSIIAISGEAGSGKTQIAFKALTAAVEQTGDPVVYIETERNRYSPDRLDSLADEEDSQSQIYRIPAYDLEQQLLSYRKVADSFDNVGLIVVDSFTARFRLNQEFSGRGDLSNRSKEMGTHIQELEKVAEELEAPVLCTAQVYGNPDQYGPSDSTYGGSLFFHSVNFMLKMADRKGKLSQAEIRNHPEVGDTEFYVNITDDDLEGMEDN